MRMQAPDFTHFMLCRLGDLGLLWILKLLSLHKNSWDLVISYRKYQLFLENPNCPYFMCLNVHITRQFFTFLHFQQILNFKISSRNLLLATKNMKRQD